MKNSYLLLIFTLASFSSKAQTTHQICVSEVFSTGACNSSSGIFTPGNITIQVGDQIQFTTYLVALSGYNGTHDIQFNGSPANNVTLTISTNILSPVTTVTTPPFTSPGVFPMQCHNANHCDIAQIMEGWPCTGYSVTVAGACSTTADFSASLATICQGSDITFTNSSSNFVNAEWKINNTSEASTNDFTNTFNSPGSYDIKLIVNNGGTCVDSTEISITVNELLEAGIDNSTNVCDDITSLDLNNFLSGADPGGVWSETSSSGQFDITTGIFNPSGLNEAVYTFNYTQTPVAPCPQSSALITVNVTPLPTANLTVNPSTTNVGQDVAIDFTANNIGNNASYNWSFCDGNNASHSSGFFYNWSTPGDFCVCLTIDNGNGCETLVCEDPITINEDSDVNNIYFFGDETPISIFPNPSGGAFTIQFDGNLDDLYITDLSGKMINNITFDVNQSKTYDLSHLAKGTYIIFISKSNEWVQQKIVIE